MKNYLVILFLFLGLQGSSLYAMEAYENPIDDTVLHGDWKSYSPDKMALTGPQQNPKTKLNEVVLLNTDADFSRNFEIQKFGAISRALNQLSIRLPLKKGKAENC